MGFIPEKYKNPNTRPNIPRVDRQKFVGFVSRLDELKNRSLFTGNAYQDGRVKYSCADMEDLAKSSQLLNKDQVAVALVERLHETGVYDERSS
jgi:hypothetical protein